MNSAVSDFFPDYVWISPASSGVAQGPIMTLPETVQTKVLAALSCADAFHFCLTYRKAIQDIWDNTDFWMHLMAVHHCQPLPLLRSTVALRDEYRHRAYGVDLLFSWRNDPENRNSAQALANACRAVNGLLKTDAMLQDAAVASVVDLMRWYDVTDSLACSFAKQLLDNVGSRHTVFSVPQVRDVWEAYNESQELRRTLLDEIRSNSSASDKSNKKLDSDNASFLQFLQGFLGHDYSVQEEDLFDATSLMLY